MDDYAEEFLSGKEGAPKSAVKRLTKKIEDDMHRLTVNAPDWCVSLLRRVVLSPRLTLLATIVGTLLTPPTWLWSSCGLTKRSSVWRTSRRSYRRAYLLCQASWVDTDSPTRRPIPRFIDLLANPEPFSPLFSLKQTLVTYQAYLTNARMENASLSQIPLPATLDPSRPIPLPTRFSTLAILVKDVLSTLIRIPFFALPFLVNLPVYFMARWGAMLVDDEKETQAQMKVMFGLLVSALVYPTVAIVIYGLAFRAGSILGGLIGLGITALFVYGLGISHRSLIDENYERCVFVFSLFSILAAVKLTPILPRFPLFAQRQEARHRLPHPPRPLVAQFARNHAPHAQPVARQLDGGFGRRCPGRQAGAGRL